MIRHIALTRFKAGTTEDTVAAIYQGLARLSETLPGAQNFGGGASTGPERIERGYMHGFTIDFDSWGALRTYAENAEHKALGGRIVANAEGGLDGVLVLDIEI